MSLLGLCAYVIALWFFLLLIWFLSISLLGQMENIEGQKDIILPLRGLQQNDGTYIYCEMITTRGLVNIDHLI